MDESGLYPDLVAKWIQFEIEKVKKGLENSSHKALLGDYYSKSLQNNTQVILVALLTSLKCYLGLLRFLNTMTA